MLRAPDRSRLACIPPFAYFAYFAVKDCGPILPSSTGNICRCRSESVKSHCKNLRLKAFAVLLALCAAQETRGINAYLKKTGPSPLRFSLTSAVPASFTLPATLVERQSSTNTPETAVPAATSAQTNAVATAPAVDPAPVVPPKVSTAESPANSTPPPSASDLLPVSPQMLTEYFKPVANGTNAASSVVVPVPVAPVEFTPPVAKPASRATYSTP